MSTWPICPLGTKVRFISGGTPSKEVSRYWGGEIPWVSSAEMVRQRIRDTELRVTEDGARDGTKLVPAKTVLVVVRGMSLAKEFRVAITERELTFNQDLKALLPSSDLDPTFLFYYLRSQNAAIRDSASEAAHGTKKLDMPVLEQWPLPVPPKDTQKKIAAILSAYDDLIENNRRRIALLEKMAEEIYREWFVRLRFPGHGQAEFEKGVPVGWREAALGEIAHINAHSLKRGHEPDSIQYIDIGAASTNQMAPPTKLKYAEAPGRARRMVRHGDVIWSSVRPGNRAYCLILNPPEALVASTGFAVISPRGKVPFTYIHRVVTTDNFVEQMVAVAKGAAYPATSFDDFCKAKVVLPKEDLLERFHDICEPMLLNADRLRKQCVALAKMRDALLPRLISGKLSVEKLDIRFPPSMEEPAHEI